MESVRGKSLGRQIIVRHAEDALDARLFSNANLNVGLFEEARFLVDPAAFDKYCFNGLKGR